jgi:hypothetical protein
MRPPLHERIVRGLAVVVWTGTGALACTAFSGQQGTSASDAGALPLLDAGAAADGTVTATDAGGSEDSATSPSDGSADAAADATTSVPDPCPVAGASICMSFETANNNCGFDQLQNVTATHMTGVAHSGTGYCHICPTAANGSVLKNISNMTQVSLTLWARRSGSGVEPASLGGTLDYNDGQSVGVPYSLTPTLTGQWAELTSGAPLAFGGVAEDIFFGPDSNAKSGDCFDIDDVVVTSN